MWVEDLFDNDDEDGVVKLFEGVIVKFLVVEDVILNLILVVVMSDLVGLFGFCGMFFKVDKFFSDFLFIKKRVEGVFFLVDYFLWYYFLIFL